MPGSRRGARVGVRGQRQVIFAGQSDSYVRLLEPSPHALGQVQRQLVLAQTTCNGADVGATVAGVEGDVDGLQLCSEQRQAHQQWQQHRGRVAAPFVCRKVARSCRIKRLEAPWTAPFLARREAPNDHHL